MMQNRTKRILGSILGCLVVLALAVGGFRINAEGQGTKETKASASAEQMIESIRTAVAAKPGTVRAVEAENENGKTFCEVEVLAQDSKTYEVKVDVTTNAVVEVEADDDDDDEDEDDRN